MEIFGSVNKHVETTTSPSSSSSSSRFKHNTRSSWCSSALSFPATQQQLRSGRAGCQQLTFARPVSLPPFFTLLFTLSLLYTRSQPDPPDSPHSVPFHLHRKTFRPAVSTCTSTHPNIHTYMRTLDKNKAAGIPSRHR